MTKVQMVDEISRLEAEIKKRDALIKEVDGSGLPLKEVNGVKVILRGHNRDTFNLFSEAMENQCFATYGGVAEALGVLGPGESFFNAKHLPPVMDFIKENELDQFVVNGQGRYGRSAPIEKHHTALRAVGYQQMPEKAEKKAKKGKTDTGKLEKLLALASLLD